MVIDEDPALSMLAPVQHTFDDLILFCGYLQIALGVLSPEVETLRATTASPDGELVACPPIAPSFRFTLTDRAKWLQTIGANAIGSRVKDMLDFVEGAISKGFLVVKRKALHLVATPPPMPPSIKHHPSTVILSATPMPDNEYSRLFPNSKVSRKTYPSIGGQLDVRHIPYSNLPKARRARNEPILGKMLPLIVQKEGAHKAYALVTSKSYEQSSVVSLTNAGARHVYSFHYGALEGLNTAQHADVCIILGINQRPVEVIIGRYLWDLNLSAKLGADDFYELTPEGVAFHDSRLEALNQHMIDSDVIQGLGRTRWVRRTTSTTVYLLSRKGRGLAQIASSFSVDDDLSRPWIEAQTPGRRNERDQILAVIFELMLVLDQLHPEKIAEFASVDKTTVNRHLRDPRTRAKLLEDGIVMVVDHQPGKRGRPGTILVRQESWAASIFSPAMAPALSPRSMDAEDVCRGT